MKPIFWGAIFAFSITAFIAEATAADRYGFYMIRGNYTCGSYVEGKDAGLGAPEYTAVLVSIAYINGYLTHYNLVAQKTYDIVGNSDSKSIEQWVYNYCKSHPLESIASAVGSLIDELEPRKTVEGPKP